MRRALGRGPPLRKQDKKRAVPKNRPDTASRPTREEKCVPKPGPQPPYMPEMVNTQITILL
jgi:hypothetical protein